MYLEDRWLRKPRYATLTVRSLTLFILRQNVLSAPLEFLLFLLLILKAISFTNHSSNYRWWDCAWFSYSAVVKPVEVCYRWTIFSTGSVHSRKVLLCYLLCTISWSTQALKILRHSLKNRVQNSSKAPGCTNFFSCDPLSAPLSFIVVGSELRYSSNFFWDIENGHEATDGLWAKVLRSYQTPESHWRPYSGYKQLKPLTSFRRQFFNCRDIKMHRRVGRMFQVKQYNPLKELWLSTEALITTIFSLPWQTTQLAYWSPESVKGDHKYFKHLQ